MLIEGIYNDMRYRISYIESLTLGAYFDVLLEIGSKSDHQRASTFEEAFGMLAKRIRAWNIEDKDTVILTSAQAAALLSIWQSAIARFRAFDDTAKEGEEGKEALQTILDASIELDRAGYELGAAGDWYHPSEGN